MNKTLYIFDIDNTLIDTKAKVRLLDKDNNVLKTLTSQEFNRIDRTKRLYKGRHWDFSEFESLEQIKSEPKLPGWYALLNAVTMHHDVMIMTARQDERMIRTWLESEGIFLADGAIAGFDENHCATVKEFKAVLTYLTLATEDYDSVVLWEDDRENIDAIQYVCDELQVPLMHYSS